MVKNDTLFLNFTFVPNDTFEKYWMKQVTCVRIFSPQLLSIEGFDTKLEMYKMKQDSYSVTMAGRSSFEVESMQPDLDSLVISQSDSSDVIFEMSPEYKSPMRGVDVESTDPNVSFGQKTGALVISKEAMTVQSLIATIQGNSLLDIGHAQIGSLHLTIADSSGILLSGGALKKVNK